MPRPYQQLLLTLWITLPCALFHERIATFSKFYFSYNLTILGCWFSSPSFFTSNRPERWSEGYLNKIYTQQQKVKADRLKKVKKTTRNEPRSKSTMIRAKWGRGKQCYAQWPQKASLHNWCLLKQALQSSIIKES